MEPEEIDGSAVVPTIALKHHARDGALCRLAFRVASLQTAPYSALYSLLENTRSRRLFELHLHVEVEGGRLHLCKVDNVTVSSHNNTSPIRRFPEMKPLLLPYNQDGLACKRLADGFYMGSGETCGGDMRAKGSAQEHGASRVTSIPSARSSATIQNPSIVHRKRGTEREESL